MGLAPESAQLGVGIGRGRQLFGQCGRLVDPAPDEQIAPSCQAALHGGRIIAQTVGHVGEMLERDTQARIGGSSLRHEQRDHGLTQLALAAVS